MVSNHACMHTWGIHIIIYPGLSAYLIAARDTVDLEIFV